jgi:hypothetical protein
MFQNFNARCVPHVGFLFVQRVPNDARRLSIQKKHHALLWSHALRNITSSFFLTLSLTLLPVCLTLLISIISIMSISRSTSRHGRCRPMRNSHYLSERVHVTSGSLHTLVAKQRPASRVRNVDAAHTASLTVSRYQHELEGKT